MAHELTIRANGTAEMAWVGVRPWHGLGNQLQAGASIEVWKQAAGMDWTIRRAMVRYFADQDTARDCSELVEMPGETVLFRSDTRAPLGIVSPDYEIVQPGAVLEFFRDLVADHGMALESAGTLFGGRRFWALAKMAEQSVGTDADKVGGYLLLCTSADGTMQTEARQTTVRVVCNNTLRMARAEDGAGAPVVKLSHRSAFCDKRVKSQLGMARDNFERGMDVARALAQVKVTDAAAQDYVRALLRPAEHAAKQAAAQVAAQPAGTSDDTFAALMARAARVADAPAAEPAKARAPKGEAAILELFANSATGGTLAGAAGTAWGLVNAVTEYVDHHATARTPDHRAASAWFGAGDDLKGRALDLAGTFFR